MTYILASQINGKDYLMTTPRFEVFKYQTLEEARQQFQQFYSVIQQEHPDSERFQTYKWILALNRPVILQFDAENLRKGLEGEIMHWSLIGPPLETTFQVISQPHVLLPMKHGFIAQFAALHIKQDIELSPSPLNFYKDSSASAT